MDPSESVPLMSRRQIERRTDYDETTKKTVVLRSLCILATEFCERLTFYSIDANLVLLFGNIAGLGTQNANILALFWKGTGYITPLLGGYLADTHFGRYKTIIIFVIIYVFSVVLLAVCVIDKVISAIGPNTLFIGLFMVSICMGGIKANVVTFGADQFENASSETKQTFFNWFYFSINCGSLISFTLVSYVQQMNFAIGLGIPAGVMFLSAVFFIMGTKLYRRLPPSGSILYRCAMIVAQALWAPDDVKEQCKGFLDRAKWIKDQEGLSMFTDGEVEDLKSITKLLPVQASFIVFWCLYAQMSSIFFSQGTVMKLQVADNFSVPVSSLQVFNSAGILLLVPLFDRIIYPLLRRKNINFSPLKRIGCGFILANLAMLYAGGLEVYRISLLKQNKVIYQKITENGDEVKAVDLSIFWQAFGFLLIGAGEVLSSITGNQFAYDEAPPTMRSMVQAIYLLTIAFGSYLGLLLVFIINLFSSSSPWIADDLNAGHLDLYFFTLCVLGLVNFYIYVYVAINYTSKNHTKISVETL